MGPSNLETLRGEVITLEKMARPESGPAMLQIRLIDFEGKQYCLPKQRCQTWFVSLPICPARLSKMTDALLQELISMFIGTLEEENSSLTSFLDDSWRDEYELRLENKLVSEENWFDILRERDENDITLHIVIKSRKDVPNDHPRSALSAYTSASFHDGRNRLRRHGYSTRAGELVIVAHFEISQAYLLFNLSYRLD